MSNAWEEQFFENLGDWESFPYFGSGLGNVFISWRRIIFEHRVDVFRGPSSRHIFDSISLESISQTISTIATDIVITSVAGETIVSIVSHLRFASSLSTLEFVLHLRVQLLKGSIAFGTFGQPMRVTKGQFFAVDSVTFRAVFLAIFSV